MRGELLGVMSLALSHLSHRDDIHYDSFDREFVGAIAGRVAIAIDNAMLFEEERRTALAFQTSLLPQEIPKLDGLEIACRYVPAKPLETRGQGIQTQVGGDWYDIIPLSAGRVAIVIGDVEGRGARAAAIMGQLRAALRAFAQDDEPPAEMLRKLDEWCRTLGHVETDALGITAPVTPIVSCTYLVYDAWTRKLTFANAGHDAPLLIVDGEVGQLEIEHKGVLLGVRSQGVGGVPPFREEQRELPPGATLVLYTDGLTDRRSRADGSGHYTEDEAAQMLRESVKSVAHKDVEALAKAAEDAVPGDIDDDMAIVVVRSAADKLPSQERVFPAEPIMVSEARRMAAETFGRWGLDHEQAELACLLVSEVVTNVVLHAAVSPSPRRALVFESASVGGGPAGRRPGRQLGAWPRSTTRPSPPGQSSLSGCGAASRRSGWRYSIRTSGCRGFAARARTTKEDAGSTWWISLPAAGAPGRPRTARRSGSRFRFAARPCYDAATAITRRIPRSTRGIQRSCRLPRGRQAPRPSRAPRQARAGNSLVRVVGPEREYHHGEDDDRRRPMFAGYAEPETAPQPSPEIRHQNGEQGQQYQA